MDKGQLFQRLENILGWSPEPRFIDIIWLTYSNSSNNLSDEALKIEYLNLENWMHG